MIMKMQMNHPCEELLHAMSQKNLVYNHDFLLFSHADYSVSPVAYGVPDGWLYSDGSSGSINWEDNHLVIVTSNDDKTKMTFKQNLHEFPRWQNVLANQRVTARIHMNVSADCLVALSLTDGNNANYEAKYLKANHHMVLDVQFKVGNNPEKLTLAIESEANAATIAISRVYANIGHMALPNLPCMVEGVIGQTKQYLGTENAPANELSLCQVAVELNADQTRLDTVLNGRFGEGANERSLLPDLRGYFLRAWDNGAEIDPNAKTRFALGQGSGNTGDHVGTWQEDLFKEHHHSIPFEKATLKPSGDSAPVHPVDDLQETPTSDVGGDETRPKNVYTLYTIKWS